VTEQIRILLLEDDQNLGSVLQEHLQLQGFEVTLCQNGEDGIKAVEQQQFDLCLADVMMPKKDGFAFAREVRVQDREIPLIFLTARSLKQDRIEGFRIGCDDYITKPFSVEELILRIQAVLRRAIKSDKKEKQQTEFQIGNFAFNSIRQLLKFKDTETKLTPKESQLLALLCLHMNETLDRDKALEEIWGDSSYFSGRSMDVFISKLRKQLKSDESVEILSIHGKGFRLVVGSD